MKVAIVHDSLQEFGGAERVLVSLIKIWPRAELYTSLVNNQVLSLLPPVKIITSFLNRLPYLKQKTSVLQMIAPLVWQGFNFEKYDLVISSSSFGLCNTIKVNKPIHVAYIHRPPKNLYDLSSPWTLQQLIPYSWFIKKYYENKIKKTKYLVTNSYHLKKLLNLLFGVKTTVIYPPVKTPMHLHKKPGKYFVTASRLDREKSVDLVIEACNKLRLPLKVLGTGKESKYLKKIAGPTIEFLGFVGKEKNSIYQSAKAFLYAAENEDFGIGLIEAMANGLPVITHYSGGPKETVINHKTGLFYYKHSTEALISVIKNFKEKNFNPSYLRNHAKQFSEERFLKEFKNYILKITKSDTCK